MILSVSLKTVISRILFSSFCQQHSESAFYSVWQHHLIEGGIMLGKSYNFGAWISEISGFFSRFLLRTRVNWQIFRWMKMRISDILFLQTSEVCENSTDFNYSGFSERMGVLNILDQDIMLVESSWDFYIN